MAASFAVADAIAKFEEDGIVLAVAVSFVTSPSVSCCCCCRDSAIATPATFRFLPRFGLLLFTAVVVAVDVVVAVIALFLEIGFATFAGVDATAAVLQQVSSPAAVDVGEWSPPVVSSLSLKGDDV
jgi:hypothetical protein